MTKNLEISQRKATSARARGRPNGLSRRSRAAAKAGWTPERRARQAALIRGWQPWRRSTGPKTEADKARCAMNALKYGYRSRARIEELRKVRYILRLSARNIELVRLYIRQRDARPRVRIKPAYAKRLLAATPGLACLALVGQRPKGLGRS